MLRKFETLISVDQLDQLLDDPALVVVDCRFDLGDTQAGSVAHEQGHIPHAVYAHLDDDLSGPPLTDAGRHPLPSAAQLTALFGRLGIDESKQVVVYDDASGGIAARLWWMLHYMGHKAVAVLDGGWRAWQDAGKPIRSGKERNKPLLFIGSPRRELLVTLEEVSADPLLVDSRAPERFRGEVEPLDPRAGHIPGAVNYHYMQNIGSDGRYLASGALRNEFAAILGDTGAEDAVFYCGSGVSACANLLAVVHAGLGDARLYVGSWSEWSADRDRPAAVGDNP